MKVTVVVGTRFERTPDGAVWTRSPCDRGFLERYLEAFERVVVVARVKDVEAPPLDGRRSDGAGVSFHALPCYVGPREYLRVAPRVVAGVVGAVRRADALILRAPSEIASCATWAPAFRKRPYAVEVVGCPFDGLGPGTIQHPLRPLLRWRAGRQLVRLCAGAAAVAYVTRSFLQRRYPAGAAAFTTHYSDVRLPDDAFVDVPRAPRDPARPFRLVFVGSLEVLYKAPDVLLDAVAHANRSGLSIELTVVGDGRQRPALEARAAAAGLGGGVRFLGQLSAGAPVRAELDRADLFVLPSRTEGLPRALIEAMARALPCVATSVGGIPELLSSDDLVPPDDALALAAKLVEIAADPARLAAMSARNLEVARKYREEVLVERRREMYDRVADITTAWLARRR